MSTRDLTVVIVSTTVLVVAILGAGLLYWATERDKVTQEKEAQQSLIRGARTEKALNIAVEAERKQNLNQCLDSAHETYVEHWKETARINGRTDDLLPSHLADSVNAQYGELKDDCHRLYN